jgi:hypothetical protein
MYKAMFPPTDWLHNMTFDKSPSYLHSFLAAVRIRRAVPHAKIVVAICDPLQRLWSHYWHMQAFPNELAAFPEFRLPFDDFVHSLLHSPEHDILRSGQYALAIAKWRHMFGAENVHTWGRDQYEQGPQSVMDNLFAFLGLPSHRTRGAVVAFKGSSAHPISQMSNASRALLTSFYAQGHHEFRNSDGRTISVHAHVADE